jgi:hypothetical protein
VDPVSDPLHLRKCDSTENRTRDLQICSKEVRSLDHRGGSPICVRKVINACEMRWVDNIKMDLVEMGRGGVDWDGLAEDRKKW